MKKTSSAATAATANEIVRTLPTSVQSIVNEMLKKGILFPSDLERLTGDPNTKYPPEQTEAGPSAEGGDELPCIIHRKHRHQIDEQAKR